MGAERQLSAHTLVRVVQKGKWRWRDRRTTEHTWASKGAAPPFQKVPYLCVTGIFLSMILTPGSLNDKESSSLSTHLPSPQLKVKKLKIGRINSSGRANIHQDILKGFFQQCKLQVKTLMNTKQRIIFGLSTGTKWVAPPHWTRGLLTSP